MLALKNEWIDMLSRRKLLRGLAGLCALACGPGASMAGNESSEGDYGGDDTKNGEVDTKNGETATATPDQIKVTQPNSTDLNKPNSGSIDSQHSADPAVQPLSLNQDAAKDAVEQGKAASLPLLLAYLNIYYPGEVLDVKLLRAGSTYLYDVKYLASTSRLQHVVLEARTLKKV